jgi:hypothetical protein
MLLDTIARVFVAGSFGATDWALLGVTLAVLVAAVVVPNVVATTVRRPRQETVRGPIGRAA